MLFHCCSCLFSPHFEQKQLQVEMIHRLLLRSAIINFVVAVAVDAKIAPLTAAFILTYTRNSASKIRTVREMKLHSIWASISMRHSSVDEF